MAGGSGSLDSLSIASLLQYTELTSYATLLHIKMSREGRVDDFRAEVFSSGDSLLSVYVRGFLGKSAFKAVLNNDSLLVYFPSEKKYFSGLRADIDTGGLSNTRHIVEYLLDVLHGIIRFPYTENWNSEIRVRGQRNVLYMDDKAGRCRLRLVFNQNSYKFPYQQLESLELTTADEHARIIASARSSSYNRDLPAEKFQLEVPPTATLLTKNELVEMLTGESP